MCEYLGNNILLTFLHCFQMFLLLVLFAVFSNSVHAGYTLRQLSYTKLPASVKNDFKLFSGTAQEGAFDHKQSILYVVGMNLSGASNLRKHI